MTEAHRASQDMHAVVTGGSRGIGRAVAQALVARGCAVTLVARDARALEETAAALRASRGRVETQACDVTDDVALQRAFDDARARLGPVTILVNNAGSAESATAEKTSREMWDRMLAVNLTATYACSRLVLPDMLAARWGRIVNVASTAGLRGYKTMSAYCAAKHGVVGLTRALALETAKHGITVNAVCPGYTDTELTDRAVANLVEALDKTPKEARAMLVRGIPRGTLTSPAEVAAAVAWLASPEAAAVTGTALPIAGGEI